MHTERFCLHSYSVFVKSAAMLILVPLLQVITAQDKATATFSPVINGK